MSVFEMGSLTKYGVHQVIACLTNETQGSVCLHPLSSSGVTSAYHHAWLLASFSLTLMIQAQVLILVQQELYWLSPLLFSSLFFLYLIYCEKGSSKQEEAILTISFLLYVQFAFSAETPTWLLGAQTVSLMNKNWRYIVRVSLLGQTEMELSRVKGSSVLISCDYKDLIHLYSSGLVSCMMTQWQHSTHYSSSFCDSCYV